MANSFPFHRCHLYIITPIFQALVDDEQASLLDDLSLASRRPQVPRTLTLVCRTWSNIVSNTPSLWSTVVLDLNKRRDQIAAHIAAVRRHSKAWPLSVFIINCHSPWYCRSYTPTPIHERSACPSRHLEIAGYLNDLEHIQRLHFQGSDAYVIQRGLSNTFFNSTREFSVDLSNGAYRSSYALMKQVRAMPQLTTLKIKGIECSHITFNTRHPVLSSLRVLYLESHQSHSPTSATLPNILSNCPNLERLYCKLKMPYGVYTFKPFKLDHLHTVDTTTLDSLRNSILSEAILTPNLTVLAHDQPVGTLTTLLSGFVLRHPGLRVVSRSSPPPGPPTVIAPVEEVASAVENQQATSNTTTEGAEVPLTQVLEPVSSVSSVSSVPSISSTSNTSDDTVTPSRIKRRGLWRKHLGSIMDLFASVRKGLGSVSRL